MNRAYEQPASVTVVFANGDSFEFQQISSIKEGADGALLFLRENGSEVLIPLHHVLFMEIANET